MGRRPKVAEPKTVPPSPFMTPTQQLAYARKKRQERYAEEHPEFLTAMRYHGTGFTTTWGQDSNVHGQRTFVNGNEITRGSIWAATSNEQHRGRGRRPKTKFEQVKKSLRHSKRNIDKIFDRAHGKFAEGTHRKTSNGQLAPKQQRNPRVVRLICHKPSSLGLRHRASIFMSKSKSFGNFSRTVDTVTKRLYRPFERRTTPVNEPIRTFYYEMTDEEKQIISKWLSGAGEGLEPDVFRVLTTAQLIKLKGATIDTIERIKSYHGPPSTPEPEVSEPEDLLGWIEEEDIPRLKCKDLIRYLGAGSHSGFHLVKESNSDSTYLDPNNLSCFYGQPLIYPDAQAAEEQEEFNHDAASSYESDDSSEYDSTENFFRPPRSHPPAQSLILYLRSRGLGIGEIAHKIAILDPDFLYAHESRLITGYCVPEYWDIDENIFEKLAEVMRAPLEEWEVTGARDRFGKVYPEGYKVLKGRMRERAVRRLVSKTLENHLWYRCKRGERPHTDIIM